MSLNLQPMWRSYHLGPMLFFNKWLSKLCHGAGGARDAWVARDSKRLKRGLAAQGHGREGVKHGESAILGSPFPASRMEWEENPQGWVLIFHTSIASSSFHHSLHSIHLSVRGDFGAKSQSKPYSFPSPAGRSLVVIMRLFASRSWGVFSIDSSEMINCVPEVLSFTRLFLKLNRSSISRGRFSLFHWFHFP